MHFFRIARCGDIPAPALEICIHFANTKDGNNSIKQQVTICVK